MCVGEERWIFSSFFMVHGKSKQINPRFTGGGFEERERGRRENENECQFLLGEERKSVRCSFVILLGVNLHLHLNSLFNTV